MPYTCPQCGAAFPSGETCQDRFSASQLIEVEQPSYYAVHHLSVLCYMLQHNGYSRDGWLGARELLLQFACRGLTPTEARRQNRKILDSGHRTWSITKGPKLPGVEDIVWSYTIAEVRLDTAEHYCTDVRHWAETVLADTEPVIIASLSPVIPSGAQRNRGISRLWGGEISRLHCAALRSARNDRAA